MAEWTGKCWDEEAQRPGWKRCAAQCASCTPADEEVREHAEERKLTVIETYSGIYFDFADPQPEQVDLRDIARALSMTRRFGGHMPRFYSVAEHAVRVSCAVTEAGGTRLLAFGALHHDDHEAYMGDWPTPLKRALPIEVVSEMEDRCDAAIAAKLGIRPRLLHHPLVKEQDRLIRMREASSLCMSRGCSASWGTTTIAEPLPDDHGWEWRRAELTWMTLNVKLMSELEGTGLLIHDRL